MGSFRRNLLSQGTFMDHTVFCCSQKSSLVGLPGLYVVLGITQVKTGWGGIVIWGYPGGTFPVSKGWDDVQQRQLEPRVSGHWERGWEGNRKGTTQALKLRNSKTGDTPVIGRITYCNLWCQITCFNKHGCRTFLRKVTSSIQYLHADHPQVFPTLIMWSSLNCVNPLLAFAMCRESIVTLRNGMDDDMLR